MSAPLRTTPDDWVAAGLRALAAGGPEAVRVETLAATLGVTKGGFYHHFADRRALLEAVLVRWEAELVDDAIDVVEDGGGDARDRLRGLFGYAGSAPQLLAAELAVRDWARRDDAVSARLARVDDRRMTFLRAQFAEICADRTAAEARCLLVMALFVGHPLLVLEHHGVPPRDVLDEALQHLLA